MCHYVVASPSGLAPCHLFQLTKFSIYILQHQRYCSRYLKKKYLKVKRCFVCQWSLTFPMTRWYLERAWEGWLHSITSNNPHSLSSLSKAMLLCTRSVWDFFLVNNNDLLSSRRQNCCFMSFYHSIIFTQFCEHLPPINTLNCIPRYQEYSTAEIDFGDVFWSDLEIA